MRNWESWKTIHFTLDDCDYTAEVILRCHEEMWGQDADGNRGILRSFIDDVEILEVIDGGGRNVTITDDMEDAIIDVAYNCDISDLDGNDNEGEE
jgi:hypothetical protein